MAARMFWLLAYRKRKTMIKQLWNNIKLRFVQDQSTNHEDQQESVPDMLETVDMSILDAETTDTEDVELPDQIYTIDCVCIFTGVMTLIAISTLALVFESVEALSRWP